MSRRGYGEATCNKCDVVLTEANWYKSAFRIGDYRCNICMSAYNRGYRKLWRNTEGGRRYFAAHRRFQQQNYIGRRAADGGREVVRIAGKRPRPDHCEMCDATPKRLVYHHWNDDDYSLGLWVCQGCHNVAHTWEDKRLRMARYRALKSMMNADLLVTK